MRKLTIPRFPTTAYMTKTSKQKKTSEEKQAKKKELDWKLYSFKFKFHSLLNLTDCSFKLKIP